MSVHDHQTGIINAVRRHGGDLRSYQLRLQVRGWHRLPPALQKQIREHKDGLVLRFGIEGCRQATDAEIDQIWAWVDTGAIHDLGDTVVEVMPWWQLPGANLHNHLAVHRRWWPWMDKPAARVRMALIYEALEPLLQPGSPTP